MYELVVVEAVTFTEQVTPFLAPGGAVIGSLIIAVYMIWNRRRGAVETRAPDVNEIWAQQMADNKALDAERALRRQMEDVIRFMRGVFRAYVARVRAGGSAELTAVEQEAHDMSVPTKPQE